MTLDNLKKNSNVNEDDHKFYEMQIKKERQETVKIKQKIAESISEYEDFVFGKLTN